MNTENINIEDIKVGETYNVRVKVSRTNTAGVYCYACDKDGTYLGRHPNLFTEDEVEAFSPVTHAPKYSEPAPKYDPCRLFKAGDIVRIIDWNGRTPDMLDEKGTREAVVADPEDPRSGCVELLYNDRYPIVAACFLELITPVEELEPYSVGGSIDGCILYKNGEHYAEFVNSSDAEKACKLLNAEHRKETQK